MMDINSIKDKIEKMGLIDQKLIDVRKKYLAIKDIDNDLILNDDFLNEHFEIILNEYLPEKIKLKQILAGQSVFEISDEGLREKVQKIKLNENVFEADERLNAVLRIVGVDESSLVDHDELSSDLITSWISPAEMAESLYENKPLILGIEIPDDLKKFIDEGRKCLAFQQYNAVYSLCRTMLETAMCDICVGTDKIEKPKNSNTRKFYRDYPPHTMIKMVSEKFSPRDKNSIHDLYDELSALIHGYKTIEKAEAKKTLNKTVGIIEELYNKWGRLIKKIKYQKSATRHPSKK